MNRESKQALQLLTGQSDLAEVPVEELQQLADAYPYFAAGQFLLLQKMQQVQHIALQEQVQKTALVFPNQPWLCYLLSQTKEKTEQDLKTATIQDHLKSDDVPVTVDIITTSETPAILPGNVSAEIEENTTATEDANLITFPVKQILDNISDEAGISSEPEESPLDEDELQQQFEPLPIEESNQKIASLLSEQAEQFSKPVEVKVDVPVTTEPFHTVDYFASQGINLDGKREDSTFDKKVHKFTDWLRQMKRINPHPVDLGTETAEETFVANIADSSNYTKEVLTESMAEVLLKQGKNNKAVEIYQKLGLLNPDKSTYFAALIQNIK